MVVFGKDGLRTVPSIWLFAIDRKFIVKEKILHKNYG